MTKTQLIFERQLGHLVWLLLLLGGLYGASHLQGFWKGEFLGLSARTWVLVSVANTIVHQVFVWFCWRTELHARLLTRLLGAAAFNTYVVIFAVMILARPLLITALAISNESTFPPDPLIMTAIAVVLAVPAVYLAYSVKRYFGVRRAFGIDHFDPSYRSAPLVRQGIFRFSANAMYFYGLLVLWIPGLLLSSTAALCIALFSHLYIWVHYYHTEEPDMKRIYNHESEP
jgi:protein-S-isoprenylcysteine O-methyltransferase Ste14